MHGGRDAILWASVSAIPDFLIWHGVVDTWLKRVKIPGLSASSLNDVVCAAAMHPFN
jgi:hypothetical protein